MERLLDPIAEVLADLGLADRGELAATGADAGLLGSPLAVMGCAVSAVGASLAAAAELVVARGGPRPKVDLDVGHVAAAVRSEAWLRDPAGRTIGGFAPLSRVWPVADGWVRTHANYSWHRSALLAAFGVREGPDAEIEAELARAFAEMAGAEIEQRAYGCNALAIAARTVEQWQRSGPGAAAHASPLVAVDQLGRDAAPLPLPSSLPASNVWTLPAPGWLPASGVRVLDLTRVIAGPVGTRMLGALGADVLRVDDPSRPELPLHAVDGVIGKASTAIDAATAGGRRLIEGLLADADVLVCGYRPGALRRLGLEADQIAERHPHLIIATLSAWGPGPWGGRRGFDSLVQVASGIGWSTSPDGTRPGRLPCQLLDHATGYLLAAGVLAALARRCRAGVTAQVRLSLARTARWVLDQPRAGASATAGARQSEADAAPYRVALGDEWTAVAPPGQLDGHRLYWPQLPPRYAASPPEWAPRRR